MLTLQQALSEPRPPLEIVLGIAGAAAVFFVYDPEADAFIESFDRREDADAFIMMQD